MTIAESTQELLRRGDVAECLRLADKYMEVYRTDRKRFTLPNEYQFLEDIIKYYARRPKGFAKYIVNIRDNFARKSTQYVELNKLYRTVFTRAVQQERRARADYAVDEAERKYGPCPSFQERLAWIARREADWASLRIAFLKKSRDKSGGKLSREETSQLLEEFWDKIQSDITTKGVPPWDE